MSTVKERPILFSGQMVRAILDGRKTQTRRVVKPQPPEWIDELHGGELSRRAPYRLECEETGNIVGYGFADDYGRRYKCPYGTPKERLWVRETFAVMPDLASPLTIPQPMHYAADTPSDQMEDYRLRPSIHMPRWASRITLEIESVRVDRLQDISDADVVAEGVEPDVATDHPRGPSWTAYKALWESINGADSWAANPWVWVIQFRKL